MIAFTLYPYGIYGTVNPSHTQGKLTTPPPCVQYPLTPLNLHSIVARDQGASGTHDTVVCAQNTTQRNG